MTSVQIKYFLLSARYLSFTRAAEECYTTQPTVSRQIALMEKELGFDLFLRKGKKVHLTPEGELMFRELSRTEEIVSDATFRARQMQNGLTGTLSIGYLSDTNTDMFVVPPAIRFVKQNPLIEMSMTTASFRLLQEKLETGEVDIIFTLSFELRSMEDVGHLHCYPIFPIVLASSEHWLARRQESNLQDLDGETFVLPDVADAHGIASEIRGILARCGVAHIKIRHVDTIESAILAVRAGTAVFLADTARKSYFDDRFVSFPLPDEFQNELTFVAVWKRGNKNPAIPKYLQILRGNQTIDVFSD